MELSKKNVVVLLIKMFSYVFTLALIIFASERRKITISRQPRRNLAILKVEVEGGRDRFHNVVRKGWKDLSRLINYSAKLCGQVHQSC